ncbi:HTH-type transcriptional regulator DmlR [Ephemeroptericola cinctiostellae]|uniref:HTH-type transcriptional regulator DmlR n=2 Tax=Ephemeroptericola cinctiostellae TaxID=2268024 RepID=A0A345DCB7_9BURK|nr:HTH-type transcriptional regulator DmlR [Ephemeroptericola cinctiostellae]
MKPLDLNPLYTFIAVVDAGSFTAASERLGVAKAKISIHIARLEAQLGMTLLRRTTRQVTLTEEGRTLYDGCLPLLDELNQLIHNTLTPNPTLSGVMRISATPELVGQSLAPAIAQFSQLHQHLQFDIRSTDRVLDMVKDGIDLSIRVGWLKDSSQRATKLSDVRQCVIASPAYLNIHGTPQTPEDLTQHHWLALSLLSAPLTWVFQHNHHKQTVQMQSRIRVDTTAALVALLAQDMGISIIDEPSVREHLATGQLIEVLPEYVLPNAGMFAVHPPGRHLSTKARAFVDFYRDFLSQ